MVAVANASMVALPQMPASVSLAYTVTVEIAFVANPYGTLVWTDVSQFVTDISTKRGKNVALGTPEAGTLSITLWNTDGRFNPADPLSPYYPNVTPRRPIRITVTAGGSYPVWRGFVNSWPQTYTMGGAYTQVTCDCQDSFTNQLDAKLGPRYADVISNDIVLDSGHGAYLSNGSTSSAGSNVGSATAIGINGTGWLNAGTTPAGSLSNSSAATTFLRSPVADGVTNTQSLYVYVPSGSAITYIVSLEMRFRIHAADTRATHPMLQLITTSSARAVYLVHSATAGSGYSLQFGTTFAAAKLSTWGDLALDQVIDLAVVREAGAAGGYKLYVNGTFWYDSTADTATLTTSPTLLQSNGVPYPLSFQFDIDEVRFYGTANPANPPISGQLTDTMAASHYVLSGLAGNTVPDFPSQTTGARVGAVLDLIKWPSGDRVLDTGLSTLAASGSVNGKTALELILEAARSELGDTFIDGSGRVAFHNRTHRNGAVSQMTLGDGTGEVPYNGDILFQYDAIRILNDITVAQSIGTAPQTATRQDMTSQTAYGVQSYSSSLPLLNASDCDGMADTLMARYKDPHQRVESVTIDLASNPALVPLVLGREIGDVIRVRRRPQGATSPIDMNNTLQGIEIHYTHGPTRTFTATLRLDPALSNATY